MKNIDLILLAAGESSRLGRPKQLLPMVDKTMIEHLIEEAITSNVANIFVVLGANKDKISEKIKHYNIEALINEEYKSGMSSSIKLGLNYLLKHKRKPDALIIMLCDQPFVSSVIINKIIEKYLATNFPIVNCNYGSSYGPPVLFDQSLFDELLTMKGMEGAKEVVQQNRNKLTHIYFPQGIKDIDTEEDYTDFLQNN
jgi:molybdenum cofactor cytidylyltransferase